MFAVVGFHLNYEVYVVVVGGMVVLTVVVEGDIVVEEVVVEGLHLLEGVEG